MANNHQSTCALTVPPYVCTCGAVGMAARGGVAVWRYWTFDGSVTFRTVRPSAVGSEPGRWYHEAEAELLEAVVTAAEQSRATGENWHVLYRALAALAEYRSKGSE